MVFGLWLSAPVSLFGPDCRSSGCFSFVLWLTVVLVLEIFFSAARLFGRDCHVEHK